MGRHKSLTPEQVELVRKNEEKKTNKEWAVQFGVSEQTISNARVGRGAYGTSNC